MPKTSSHLVEPIQESNPLVSKTTVNVCLGVPIL